MSGSDRPLRLDRRCVSVENLRIALLQPLGVRVHELDHRGFGGMGAFAEDDVVRLMDRHRPRGLPLLRAFVLRPLGASSAVAGLAALRRRTQRRRKFGGVLCLPNLWHVKFLADSGYCSMISPVAAVGILTMMRGRDTPRKVHTAEDGGNERTRAKADAGSLHEG